MIGQRNLTSRLGALIRLKKLPRFIILVGEVGSGRRTVAKWLADEMSADFIEVDKSVEAVREVIEKCYKASGATVYFIADGDTLSNPAKSALLKITEEPPKNAYFVMSTTDAENVLPTLVSRAFVYRMDSYSIADIAEFLNDPKADLRAYANCCTNGREVNLVKQWGKEFFDFVTLVIDNIADVSGSNALKMENRIAFTDDADSSLFDVKIFLQAFRAECMRRIMNNDDRALRDKYIAWIQITSRKLSEIQIKSINKQNVFDMWVFDIRGVVRNAEGTDGQ